MDTKRVILALVLSFLVFFGWQMLFPQPKAPQTQPATQEQQSAPAAQQVAQTPAETAAPIPAALTSGKKITVKTPLYTAIFNTQGGLLESFSLNNYNLELALPRDGESQQNAEKVDMVGGPTLGINVNGKDTWSDASWDQTVEGFDLESGEKKLVFTGRSGDFEIERTLTITADNYFIQEKTRIRNLGPAGEINASLTATTDSLSASANRYNPAQVAYLGPQGLDEEADGEDLSELPPQYSLSWAAVDNNYFILAVLPEGQNTSFTAGKHDKSYWITFTNDMGEMSTGSQEAINHAYFIGPMERDLLEKASPALSKAVNFGWFDFIAKPLLLMLVWLYSYVGNYGVAIIVLTIIIKGIFWPLSQKSYKSMEQMKKLQPMMQKIREKHKGDKQAANQEIMQLYKTYKVNPAGGCLPMVIQIPVFFGLYKALLGAIELRHAGFIDYLPFTDMVWLADLSSPDPYYITPIVMGLTMLLQQLMSPSTGDPTQKKIMMIMPIVFTFLFLGFPSGLVIYWLCNNVLSIGQQTLLIKSNKK